MYIAVGIPDGVNSAVNWLLSMSSHSIYYSFIPMAGRTLLLSNNVSSFVGQRITVSEVVTV